MSVLLLGVSVLHNVMFCCRQRREVTPRWVVASRYGKGETEPCPPGSYHKDN